LMLRDLFFLSWWEAVLVATSFECAQNVAWHDENEFFSSANSHNISTQS